MHSRRWPAVIFFPWNKKECSTKSSNPLGLNWDTKMADLMFRDSIVTILGDPGATNGTIRYFRAKVYFKSWRAPGNLFLPNQFHKWSNSLPLIGQKKYFSAQSARSSSQVTLSPSYAKYFSSSIDQVGWPVQREDCRGEFQKKMFTAAEEIAALDMGARNQYSSIDFLGGLFIEGIS